MGLDACAMGLASRTMGRASVSGEERLSPRYWDLLRRTNQRKVQLFTATPGLYGSERSFAPDSMGQKNISMPAQPAVDKSASRGAVFGPPVAMKVGSKLVSIGDAPWPGEHMQWAGAGAGAAAISIGMSHPALGPWGGDIPETERPVKHGAIHQSLTALLPIAAMSLAVIAAFSVLYVLSGSLVSQVAGAPLQAQDHFFYSLRTFLTFSAVDTAAASSLGRFLSSAEGLLGYLVMLWFAVKIGQLTGGGEK